METIRSLFETNTFGAIALTKACLPQFRRQNSGVNVNVSSAETRKQGATIPESYADSANGVFGRPPDPAALVTLASDVTAAIWRAVTDPSCPSPLAAGADAVAWAQSSSIALTI